MTRVPNRLIGLSVRHPDATERRNGQEPYAQLTISRNLKSGALDDVPLDRGDLLKLIRYAAGALLILDAP